ncbi:MAG: hypothetical protein JW768_04640 [Chitinispirillaceae bacterium]|nr:hypothetical protein [Chitinispirillaceae bacterium]
MNMTIAETKSNRILENAGLVELTAPRDDKKSPASALFLDPSHRKRVGIHLNGSKSVAYKKNGVLLPSKIESPV